MHQRMNDILRCAGLVIGLYLICAVGCGSLFEGPLVAIETDAGEIIVRVDEARAPQTAGQFLKIVDLGLYKESAFYRVVREDNQDTGQVKITVIQGGLELSGRDSMIAPIPHESTKETGIRHQNGTISMARAEPGTATSEFFICIGPQPELDFGGRRNPDGQGFAAFGRVILGMDIVRKIQAMPADGQMLTPPVQIHSITRVD